MPMLQLSLFSPSARLVLLSSSGIYASKKIDPEDLNSTDILGGFKEGEITGFETLWALSARSKAQQVVFCRELAAKLASNPKWSDISVSSCHPGTSLLLFYREPG